MSFFEQESIHAKRAKKILESLAVGTGIILFWRGIWNLADIYIYPSHETVSAFLSFFIGVLILLLTRSFVKQFLGEIQEEELRAEKSMLQKLLGK